MWLWAWSGWESDVPGELRVRTRDVKGKAPLRSRNDNPFLVDEEDEAIHIDAAPAPFLLTLARTLDKDSRRAHTYGIGFTLPLTAAEVLSANNTLLGDHGVGSGAGIGAVGRWTAGGRERERAVEAKLRRWAGLFAEPAEAAQDALPTPTKTPGRDDGIPPIPCGDLPVLPPSTGNLLPAFALAAESSTPTAAKPFPSRLEPPAEMDVFGPVIALPPPKGGPIKAKPGSVEERRQALNDRVSIAAGPSSSLRNSYVVSTDQSAKGQCEQPVGE